MSDVVVLSPVARQMVHYNLAMFCNSGFGNDLYYLCEAVNHLLACVGKDAVIVEVGKERSDVLFSRLDLISDWVSELKVYYDVVCKDQDLVDRELLARSFAREHIGGLAVVQGTLFELFTVLVRMCNIAHLSIPSDHFSSVQKEVKRIVSQ